MRVRRSVLSHNRPLGRLDGLASKRLYYECRNLVRRIVFHSGLDAETCADLEQETWMRATRSHDRYDPGRGRYDTWIATIANNVVRDHLRHEKRERTVGELENPDRLPAPQPPSVDGDEKAKLAACLELLNDKERAVCVLSFSDGLSCREVARLIGLAPARVIQIKQNAVRKLRTAMEDGSCREND